MSATIQTASPAAEAPAPQANKRFLSSAEVMAMLGFQTKGAFHQFWRAQGLPAIKINERRFIFDRQAVEDWLARRTMNGGGL